MILESKKFIFNTINVLLEDEKLEDIVVSKKYSKISATSYKEKNLPNFDVNVKTTALIGLTQEKDDIFKKFNDTTRNEIRKTGRNDDLKFASDDSNFGQSYFLYKGFEYMQGRVPVSKKDLTGCRLFGAYYKGDFVSGIYVMESCPYLRIRSIFSKRLNTEDKELYKIISNSTRRLVWEICRWGKEKGFVSLDMASVNFKNPKTANITKFKMSFGGEVVNEYTYTYKSNAFKFFEKFVVLKLLALKFLRIFKRS